MANSVRILLTAKDDISGTLDRVRDKASLLGKTDIGKGMFQGAGIAAFGAIQGAAMGALDAVVSFGAGSVRAASDSREAMALNDQVFERNAASIRKWADAKDDAFSATEAVNFAAQFGTAFKNVGMTLDDTTARAEEMTKLAGDLGSAFNASSEEAATALRSGLLGESEPLRRFGVFLDEAKVKARAAAMGMEPLNGALTDGQKVAARYALIMEQTADSQGMFGRDSGSLADTQKLLAAQIDDLQAKLGTKLMPVLLDLSRWANDEGVPALEAVIGAADKAGEAFRGLEFIQSAGASEFARGRRAWEDQQAAMEATTRAAKDAAYQALTGNEAQRELNRTLRLGTDALGDVGTETNRVSSSLERAVDPAHELWLKVQGLGRATGTTADRMADLKRRVDDVVESMVDAQLGPQELKLKLADLNAGLAENQKHLAALRKIDHPTKAQRDDIRETSLEIIDQKREYARLLGQQAALGKADFHAYRESLRRLGIVVRARTEDYWALARAMLAVNQGAGSVNDGGSTRHGSRNVDRGQAAGGVNAPYTSRLVGERGPEIVRFGAVGGSVNPSVAAGGGGGTSGQPLVIQLSVDGRTLAQVAAPYVTAWQQDRLLLARR